jgi:hypothetical protein
VNTGGRRSPLGQFLGGLTCCAFLIVVLGLGLGTGSTHSPVGSSSLTSISHAVTTVHPPARPAPLDQSAVPSVTLVLVVAGALALVRERRVVPRPVLPARRRTGRAPPGPLTHR